MPKWATSFGAQVIYGLIIGLVLGFIAVDGGQDVFVHYSAIDSTGYRSLDEAQRVEFEVTQGPKGPQADHVRPV